MISRACCSRRWPAGVSSTPRLSRYLAFERLDPCAGGGRGKEGAARALGQAGRLGDMDEQAQVGEIEMHGHSMAFGKSERAIA
jgi:hypothetical protein